MVIEESRKIADSTMLFHPMYLEKEIGKRRALHKGVF